ncbi:uncharacterized protein LOC119613069 [Lucilia sericata]|uniref:uncharacterized protein LOC119613069 n=1 Tax=Lucilia sericata TaxID=13632 RepID=UPI0018A7F2C4|nr:uncharacterized protein LOC119613069 [Lucilia sericata]
MDSVERRSQWELKHFQLCTVTYGTSSAPHLSVRVLEQLARDYQESHPNASRILLEDFYVDDVLTGASSEEELILNRKELIDLLSQAGLELSKWVSNCESISPPIKNGENFLREGQDKSTKVLGIYWNSEKDSIQYSVNLNGSQLATKRKVISDVARIFDPLVLVSPIVVKFKILFQEIWLLNLEWDKPLPQDLARLWIKYRDDLHNLTKLKLPRYVPNLNTSIQQHGFSDASIKAYAAVVYCRMEDAEGNISITLIASKTRVAPLKQISLPRLELCLALLLTRLIKTTISSLSHQQIDVKRFINLRIHKIKNPAEYLTCDEIRQGKIICLRMAQNSFSAEKKSLLQERKVDNNSKLIQLSPFIDNDGLIRVGGRISNSELSSEIQHPIILPKGHKITTLILREEHVKNLHPGVSFFDRQADYSDT